MEIPYETIEKAKAVAICLGDNPQEHDLLCAEALGAVFGAQNTDVHFFPETPASFKEKWGAILPSRKAGDLVYSTKIRIPKNNAAVKELTYDNDGEFFTLNIGATNKHIRREEVLFETGPANIDIAFFFREYNGTTNLVEKEKRFLLTPTEKTITEHAFNIIQKSPTRSTNSSQINTLLFAALISETNNLDEGTHPDILIMAGNLLKSGADKISIKKIMEQNQGQSFPQLLGRALARTQTNEDLKSVWTFISQQDLEKTNTPNADTGLMQKISTSIRKHFPSQQTFVVLWQNKDKVQGTISREGDSATFLRALADTLKNCELKNSFCLTGPYQNFSEAEIKIQEALKK